MRFAPLYALTAALIVALAGSVAAAGSAEAQQAPKKRTRVVITQRSYLDPGTMVKPRSQPNLNYAFPPGYNFPNYQGSGVGPGPITGLRWPLPGPFDLPGY